MKNILIILLVTTSALNLFGQTKATQIWLNTEHGAYSIDATIIKTTSFIELNKSNGQNLLKLTKRDSVYFRNDYPNEIWTSRYENRALVLCRKKTKEHPKFKEYRVQNFKTLK